MKVIQHFQLKQTKFIGGVFGTYRIYSIQSLCSAGCGVNNTLLKAMKYIHLKPEESSLYWLGKIAIVMFSIAFSLRSRQELHYHHLSAPHMTIISEVMYLHYSIANSWMEKFRNNEIIEISNTIANILICFVDNYQIRANSINHSLLKSPFPDTKNQV